MKGLNSILKDVTEELLFAIDRFGEFRSAHEGYAVILEELEELWLLIKVKQRDRNPDNMRKEAIQLAAMVLKFILYIDYNQEDLK